MPDEPVPTRRVSFTVTGYLRHGHPVGGWYDMQAQPDGGQVYSIPESEVDEASVTDAPPETLTDDDWSEIAGQVHARLGAEAGSALVAQWRRIAEAAE